MKTNSIVFLLLFFAIPSIYGQSTLIAPVKVAHATGATAIRSVVAQGGELRLLLHVGQAGAYQVNICSVSGELVCQEAIQGQIGETVKDIAFDGHPHGIYVLNLIGATGQIAREVMW
jgi:hypothetical protein